MTGTAVSGISAEDRQKAILRAFPFLRQVRLSESGDVAPRSYTVMEHPDYADIWKLVPESFDDPGGQSRELRILDCCGRELQRLLPTRFTPAGRAWTTGQSVADALSGLGHVAGILSSLEGKANQAHFLLELRYCDYQTETQGKVTVFSEAVLHYLSGGKSLADAERERQQPMEDFSADLRRKAGL